MSDVWLAALALMLVVEGILPFTAPRIWRDTSASSSRFPTGSFASPASCRW
jgi:uncharacterized protein YjeT (DUF2065 family)